MLRKLMALLPAALLVSACHLPKKSNAADAASPAQLADHLPVSTAKGRHLGHLPDNLEIDLRITLHSRDTEGAEAYARRVYDPKDRLYGKFLTPEQYHARFGPDHAGVKQACDHLEKQGLTIDQVHGHVMHVKGRVSDIERAFATELHEFDSDFGVVRAPLATPTVPADTGILGVHGLATPAKRRTHLSLHPRVGRNGFTGRDIRKAYEVPDSATGAGEVLGLLQLDSYDPADIKKYCADNNLREVPRTNVLLAGFDGKVMDPGAQGEVTLDIELMNAMAPGAKEIRVFMASQANNGFFDILNEMANPTRGDKKLVKAISCSWGAPESAMDQASIRAESVIYRQMAIQGQSFFVASGDDGARDDGQHIGTDDPASQVYTVAVGGTSLYTKQDGTYSRESAWLNGGGGISMYWAIPPWQKGASGAGSLASAQKRNVPDVSMCSDPATGYAIYVQGHYVTVGGTSCAAPLWGAVWGLVAEARAKKGLPEAGFFSPAFYTLMKTADGRAAMHDVLDKTTNGYYPAVSGRDNVTGFGTPRVGKLLQAFAK